MSSSTGKPFTKISESRISESIVLSCTKVNKYGKLIIDIRELVETSPDTQLFSKYGITFSYSNVTDLVPFLENQLTPTAQSVQLLTCGDGTVFNFIQLNDEFSMLTVKNSMQFGSCFYLNDDDLKTLISRLKNI